MNIVIPVMNIVMPEMLTIGLVIVDSDDTIMDIIILEMLSIVATPTVAKYGHFLILVCGPYQP